MPQGENIHVAIFTLRGLVFDSFCSCSSRYFPPCGSSPSDRDEEY
ncbi:MAG: hypothetical protein ACREL1_01070 [bacterium]